jgi:hypothetical protein
MYKAGDDEETAYFRAGNAKVYKAMMDYYVLKNFDNLTDYILGELITVNPV